MNETLIVLEVHSGVAECVRKPKGVRVVIKDYDSREWGVVCTSMSYEEDEEVNEER